MTKTLKDFLEVYKPKSPDEQKFVDKHVTIKHKDLNGNGDDVFNAANVKTIKRKEERKGYDPGEDEKVYEALKGDQHKIDANKNGKVDAHDFKLLRAKKKVAEEVEEVEEARVYPGDYHVTSEKSQFGGHRPKVVHKDKGHTMYLGQHAYKKPAMAIRHGEAYLTAYAARGDRAADNASIDFARANKKHLYVKEDIDIENVLDEALDLLMSIDEKTLTPAEMKKREEVVKAIKRENPKMDKSMAYAVATKTAKRVAEEVDDLVEDTWNKMMKAKTAWASYPTKSNEMAYKAAKDAHKKAKAAKSVAEGKIPTADEPTDHDKKMAQKVRDLLAKEKKPVKEDVEEIDEGIATYDKKGKLVGNYKDLETAKKLKPGHHYAPKGTVLAALDRVGKPVWAPTFKEEVEEIDEISKATMGRYINKAKDHIDTAAWRQGYREAGGGSSSDKLERKLSKRHKGIELAVKKLTKEETEDLDESAKIADHLIKRYGDNVRKSHVRSAANDFGVGYVALSHAVRKKLGVNRLEEEQIDEISAKKLTDYTAKASDARGHRDMPAAKLDKRYKGVALAHEKIRQRHAKVGATNEEVEELDELSKKTLGNYTYKAASELGSKGITTGLKIAADEPTEKNFKKLANRQKGVASAVKRLTKEDIINRSVEKYVPEELKFTAEERLLKRLDGLSEAHVKTLLGLFEALNKDNQNKMIETVETREGINQLLNFALENRGE